MRDVTPLPDLLHGRPSRAGAGPPAGLCRPAAAVQRRLPGRREHPGLARAHPGGPARAGLAAARRRQPAARDPRARLLPPVRERLQPRRASTAPSRSTRSSASSATLRSSTAGCSTRRRLRTGKRVLVIGAGPSGLSAAYHLARLGHEVEIRDAGAEPGGMMRYGIPAYRLPARRARRRDRPDRGARRADHVRPPGRGPGRRARGGRASTRSSSPSARTCPSGSTSRPRDAGRIVDAVSFLRSVASGERPVIGRRVAVYGGGNTAMDAARVARRLGAEEAMIVYRRTREQMPAHDEEAEDAEREGVRINWLRTITAFDGPELQVEVMELDESGYPQPTGRFETLAADTVILALGQETDTEFLRDGPGSRVRARRHGAGVDVAADRLPGRVRRRRHGAERAHASPSASGTARRPRATSTPGCAAPPPRARRSTSWRRFDKLHLWYFGDAARRAAARAAARASGSPASARWSAGSTPSEAVYEAGRCLSCGNCFECDGCLGACPEDAVIKLGAGQPLPVRLRPLHGLRRRASSSARCTRSRWSRSPD